MFKLIFAKYQFPIIGIIAALVAVYIGVLKFQLHRAESNLQKTQENYAVCRGLNAVLAKSVENQNIAVDELQKTGESLRKAASDALSQASASNDMARRKLNDFKAIVKAEKSTNCKTAIDYIRKDMAK